MERPYRLSARFVATIEQPGRYGDGRGSGGLSLLVKHTTRGHLAKSWAQRINVDGHGSAIWALAPGPTSVWPRPARSAP